MNLIINSINNNNSVFCGRTTKFSKEQMDRVLLPLFNYGDVINVQYMSASSGYTKRAIGNWFYETYGITIAKYLNSIRKNKLKHEMEDFYRRGVPIKEVAAHFGHSMTWVNDKYAEFGFKYQKVNIDAKEKEKILAFARAGYVVEYIAEKFKHSTTTIQKLMDIHFKEGLVKYRHDNNIPIKHKENIAELEIVEKIKSCFAEGKSIKETAKIIDGTSQKVLYLKEKYGLKSKFDIAHERMNYLLPKMVEMKMGIRKMVEEIGLSAQTIRRRIKELYGKTYLDIRMGK